MKRVFYEQEVYLLLDLTKLNPALIFKGAARIVQDKIHAF